MEKVYGYYNGKPYATRDEFIYATRKHPAIQTDDELIAFAENVTSNWFNAGWHRTFTTFYLSDYALAEPYRSLTRAEFARLKELQKAAQAAAKAAEDAREWRKFDTIYWMDNSVEEIWQDKDGIKKTVMVVGPHGDAC